MRSFLCVFLLYLCSTFVSAKDALLVLSSGRNAETIAEAARLLKYDYPQLDIIARSDSQLSEMETVELGQLISSSRAILGIGLYGASVSRLSSILPHFSKNMLFVSSDHRLLAMSQIDGQFLLSDSNTLRTLARYRFNDDPMLELKQLGKDFPKQIRWLMAKAYWDAGGVSNTQQLFQWYLQSLGEKVAVTEPQPLAKVRWYFQNKLSDQFPLASLRASEKAKVFIIDHAGGGRPADLVLLRHLCDALQQQLHTECLAALAYWGEAGVAATTEALNSQVDFSAVVMLQDFVIGAGEGREQVTEMLKQWNLPVFKAIKQRDRTSAERLLSSDGLAQEKVYYQVAMPELQGASQPIVIATAGLPGPDPTTGIRIQSIERDDSGVSSLVNRIKGWQTLQSKQNADKRLAIIYYNHPPGRHNIGADNLDVPASLWHMLNQLKAAGYDTGQLPESQEQLLDLMQKQGVNLANDRQALQTMSGSIQHMSVERYNKWFNQLPETVQQEMFYGPFGLLHNQIASALQAKKPDLAKDALHHVEEEMLHLLEGVDHPARQRALNLLHQLEAIYDKVIDSGDSQLLAEALNIIEALTGTGIEGLSGWGPAPGKVMVHEQKLLLPGIQFGNVFVGPQPPRGWEINEELLHANLAFPPPHQYLAFYHYLQDEFQADALIHLGRHSTYEFLPRRSVGIAEDDYSHIIAGDIPGIYPYIVDGVGEGIQAKRRGLAVMIDHLTPPLAVTPLYDELLQLRQMVESYEASHASGNEAVAARLVRNIRQKLDKLDLKEEIAQAIAAELAIMGISFEDVDDDMLVHEVGHYLTELQERFMPLGLHVFGRDWEPESVTLMLSSMGKHSSAPSIMPEDVDARNSTKWQELLQASPRAEMASLMGALDGGFVAPGQGNDPIRSPDSLPTGRNFYALSSSLIPSKVAWEIGQEMAQAARKENSQRSNKREAVILWASDVVRDEGVMIAFGLDMLGLEPIWNSRGLVKGLKHQEVPNYQSEQSADEDKLPRIRRDTVFTTSGLFRDLYGQQMKLLDQATLMALDASRDRLIKDYPALTVALQEALEPLGVLAKGGAEPLATNQVAAHWLSQALELLKQNTPLKDIGIIASRRVFGDAPGSFGAGVNRLVERSGAWNNRTQLAQVFIRRLGHSYGLRDFGKPAQAAYQRVLQDVENTYLGRASNLYGLLDNNDAFDYFGGLSLAVETSSGQVPNNFVMDHADPTNIKTRPLGRVLRQELRGRFLNPKWLQELMEHGYAGARTMGSEFIEYLWGWQVTNPTLVGDWAWQEVKAVYIDDKHQLGLDDFLEQGHNVHVKTNMLAVMLVAVHKEFWKASEQDIQTMAELFYNLVKYHGLPGSGHTDPDHPMLDWLQSYLSESQQRDLQSILQAARLPAEDISATQFDRITELTTAESESQQRENMQADEESSVDSTRDWLWLVALLAVILVSAGMYRAISLSRRLGHKG